ncbi:MAG: glucosaminidase domain-containing protein [Flavobacteriales bacterium]|jgi:LysM repeat protein|nr:glucosaminidase domain-containing protein [Flavobacteriales bacterium]MCB0759383.1 glucosaminidase domain-containing protein [Flavobacteriales bacterium]
MKIQQVLKTFLAWALIAVLAPAQAQAGNADQTPEQYIAKWKDVAVRKMKEHGIPASITLAQGLLESRSGNSILATQGNNHFGIKCTPDWTGGKVFHDDDKKNDCFRKYRSADQSFEDHSKFLMRSRYARLFELKPTDYKGWAHGLKQCGYATDPRYPHKLIDIIERYKLDNLDRGVDVSYASKGAAPAKTAHKPSKHAGGRSDDNVVTIGNARPVELFDGRIKFVRARKGETVKDIADEIQQMPGLVANWNDIAKDGHLEEGQVVYIQPKRNKSKQQESCIAQQGETLWGISQRYGVKLKRLAKYNDMGIADPIVAGQKVWLRKPRR